MADERAGDAGFEEHAGENVAIEHACYRDSVGGGFDARGSARGFDQSFAMMGAGAAQECAVDIEEN